ncbi:MAG: VOC family protein [Anaerotruncus sp.]|nr:VOC family protein [Anaerotruncus sp.]
MDSIDVKSLNFSLAHLGVNQETKEEAAHTVALMKDLFGFESTETEGSYFVNDQFEVMKMPFLGRLGHVALYTDDAVKAKAYLEGKGVAFDETTAGYDANGRLMVIYFKDEIAGYAFHLKQR